MCIVFKLCIFVTVRIKGYSILLLLSFLLALGHEMIPHHHHEMEDMYSFLSDSHTHQKAVTLHTNADPHSKLVDLEEEHDHSFPDHKHISLDSDFDYLRVDLKKNISISQVQILATINFVFVVANYSLELETTEFVDPSSRIVSLFKPGIIGLRAPPFIV